VNSAEKSGSCIDPRGYDAGKKIKGKKTGPSIGSACCCTRSSIRPTFRAAMRAPLVSRRFAMHAFFGLLSADGSCQGAPRKGLAAILSDLAMEIVRRPDHPKGFVALPRRWIVERTLAWLNAVEGRPGIGKTSAARAGFLAPRINSPEPHASCFEGFVIPHNISGQTGALGLCPRQPAEAHVPQVLTRNIGARGSGLRRVGSSVRLTDLRVGPQEVRGALSPGNVHRALARACGARYSRISLLSYSPDGRCRAK